MESSSYILSQSVPCSHIVSKLILHPATLLKLFIVSGKTISTAYQEAHTQQPSRLHPRDAGMIR
jgi:hypothetical protein